MKVMVIVKATKNSEAGGPPSEEMLAEMGVFNEELMKAGVLLTAEGLTPSARGKRVKFTGASCTVVDGPFAEARELIAGYWIWQVQSLEEAVAWARRCPAPHPGEDAELEIRPFFDLNDILTPEQRARQVELRSEIARRGSTKT